MSDNTLGALSSYALTVQHMKVATVKAAAQAEQAVVDLLSKAVDDSSMSAASATRGHNVDISV
jgi:saccharopine dehydrogenase-like NADP-dependent oxidoreductase